MKKLRSILVFIAALALVLVIIDLQLNWNLHSPKYLQGVAARSGTNEALVAALPEYAAGKLPNPEATKAAFTQYVGPVAVKDTLASVYLSIAQAFTGKTDIVEIDVSPITAPLTASGYQIPPGTVFASDTVQVGGLAAILRLLQRSLLPALIVLAVCVGMVVLLGIKRGIAPSLRNVLLVTCLLLAGLFVATLGLPLLVSSLVSSSGLDAALREIVLKFVNTIIADSGRYYIAWIVVLGAVTATLSIAAGLVHRARRPNRKHKKLTPAPQPEVKEL